MPSSIPSGAPRWLTSPWTIVLCAAAAWLAFIIFTGLTRSGWVDELFIVLATDPTAPLQSLVSVWRTEPHPPTYTALLLAWRHVLDAPNLFTLRAFGILVSALLATGAIAYWRARKWPGIGVFALLLFTAPAVLFFPQEARSYFFSTFGGVYAALFLTRAFETREPGAPTATDGLLGVVAVILLGTHLMSLTFACLLFGIAIIALIIQRRWAWLRMTLLIGVFVAGPMIVFTGVSIYEGMSRVLSSFWITRQQLLQTVVRLPWLIGAPLLLTLLWAVWKRATLTEWRERAALGLILAIAASVFALGCISLVKPMLLVRYLVAPAAALTVPATILLTRVAPLFAGKPIRSAIAALLCFVTGIVAVDVRIRPHSDWRQPAQFLNSISSCNGALIPYLIFNHPPERRNIFHAYFEWYAPDHTFAPATPDVVRDGAQQACPVRLWMAHLIPHQRTHITEEYRAAVRQTCAAGERVALPFADGYLVVDANASNLISSWPSQSIGCSEIPLDGD